MKKLASISLATLSLLTFMVPAVHGAGYSYGSMSIAPGSAQGLLTYRTIDVRQASLCDLTTFVCDPKVTSTPPIITGELGPSNYTLSPSGRLALVPEVSATGAPINNIYKVTVGALSNPRPLPVTEPISRILFTPDETKVVIRTAGSLALIDLTANILIKTIPWTVGDYFSFPQVSPNGNFLSYYSPARESSPVRQFRLVDFSKGKIYSLSHGVDYWDLLSEEDTLFRFSPDNKFLIYKDDRNGPQTLYQVDLANLKGNTFLGTRLFTKSYSVADFMLTDARTLIYIANRTEPLRWDLFSYDLKSGKLTTINTNVSYYPALQRANDLIVFNRLVSWGSETVAYNIKTGAVRTFSKPNGTFTTLKNGKDLALPGGLHGALLLPDNFNAKQPHQLVVWLHGGPYRQTSIGYHPYPSYGVYDWMLEGLRESGVVVLKLDYSGSYGYGRPFAESLKGNVGVKDVKDVFTAVNSLRKTYNLSDTRLMGVSYGGYLSLRAMVERPASFAGAISINGVTDWLTLVNNNPNTIFAADFEGPLTVENEVLYDHASVISKLPTLTNQRTLLIHSTADSEVSYSQSSSFAGILQSAGKNVNFISLEGDDHVLTKQMSAMTVCKATFEALGLVAGEKCTL